MGSSGSFGRKRVWFVHFLFLRWFQIEYEQKAAVCEQSLQTLGAACGENPIFRSIEYVDRPTNPRAPTSNGKIEHFQPLSFMRSDREMYRDRLRMLADSMASSHGDVSSNRRTVFELVDHITISGR